MRGLAGNYHVRDEIEETIDLLDYYYYPVYTVILETSLRNPFIHFRHLYRRFLLNWIFHTKYVLKFVQPTMELQL